MTKKQAVERFILAGAEITAAKTAAGVVPLALLEKQAVFHAIAITGHVVRAGQLLGLGKTTIYQKLKEYGLTEGK
jgi:transcriptional regulator of acetoin/glycerol metabolism